MIDALGPFCVTDDTRATVNWSKVPFATIETGGRLTKDTRDRIARNFETYVGKVAALGYDSLSIDDLAHLVVLPFYNSDLQALLGEYRLLYKRLFAIAGRHGMCVFVNTDYLFFNDDIRKHLLTEQKAPDEFYAELLEQALARWPQIDGVILRVGEKDGNDVTGHFLSQLMLRTPAQANALIKKILPVFETRGKTLVFRTWTVGAYPIGDLIWNKKTYDKTFAGITSDALVVSMKYGDTDFMRHLALNPLFGRGGHKTIVELQTRREWEGMGMFPSFVGWDYAGYLRRLAKNPNVIGLHAWCQTGGWAKREWSNLTYLDGSSPWNELNTEVTIDIARYGMTVEQAIDKFCERRQMSNTKGFIELLRHSDIAIKKGLYVADLAQKSYYFRRTRIPTLMWATWDRIHVPSVVVYLHRMLLPRPNDVIAHGAEAESAADRMIALAEELGLSDQMQSSLRFERDTLVIFADLRQYMLRAQSDAWLDRANAKIATYERTYPQHYSFPRLVSVKNRRLRRSLLVPFVRESRPYRKRDRIFLKTSPLQARLIRYYLRLSKSHLSEQSMGLETLFK